MNFHDPHRPRIGGLPAFLPPMHGTIPDLLIRPTESGWRIGAWICRNVNTARLYEREVETAMLVGELLICWRIDPESVARNFFGWTEAAPSAKGADLLAELGL